MSLDSDELSVSALRKWRDEQLREGRFASASGTQKRINEQLDGEDDETAALSAGRDQRLHEELDDLDELRDRRDDAEEWGFPKLAAEYDERIDELTPDPEPSDAALEEQTRAALAAPDDETLEQTEAALSADDVVEAAERGQAPPQYIFDAYGLDLRDFDDEYELRDALRNAERKRLPEQQEEISTERAALSIRDRAELDTGGQTPAGLIREKYGLDPEDYEDAEELRAAIVAQGGYKSGVGTGSERFHSALSSNLEKNGNGD